MARAAAALTGLVVAVDANHGYKRSDIPREIVGEIPEEVANFHEERIPAAFDWRNVNGENYVVSDWNQHIPTYCGGCWIHGTLSALNDRIKVLRGGAYPDVMLGRQAAVNCVRNNSGCDGGDAWQIHHYMHKHALPDESCMPYRAENMECNAINTCRNCIGGDCWAVKDFVGYHVKSYGSAIGEKAMMKEIYARGPIACSFATDDPFMYNYSENAIQHEGVYVPARKYNKSEIDHIMEVAGWGETASGRKYWVVRNSWGTYWGESGWLKLLRGTNELQSESECAWGVPTWKDLDEDLHHKVLGDYRSGIMRVNKVEKILRENLTHTAKAVDLAAEAKHAEIQGHIRNAAVVSVTFFGGLIVTLGAYGAMYLSSRPDAKRQPLLQCE